VVNTRFYTQREIDLGRRFLDDGYVIADCEAPDVLRSLVDDLRQESNRWLAGSGVTHVIEALDASHAAIPNDLVNGLRLHLFAYLNADTSIRVRYFSLARTLIEALVGNELAMQIKVNLSIQQPRDPASVLDIHSDVWTGDSPFQVVLWTPLTDTTESNAMFLLPPRASTEALRLVQSGELSSMAAAMKAYRSQVSAIDMRVGQVLVFNSNCLHGNQLNTTSSSRWSLNCRFVSLLAPATNPERRLGTYYSPITVRPATRVGLEALNVMGKLD